MKPFQGSAALSNQGIAKAGVRMRDLLGLCHDVKGMFSEGKAGRPVAGIAQGGIRFEALAATIWASLKSACTVSASR